MNTNNDCTTSSVRTISLTLITIINDTTEYSKSTYVYEALFDKLRFTEIMYNGDNDLIDARCAILSKL